MRGFLGSKSPPNLTVTHIQESIVLWALINDFLGENVEDDITWKHTASRHYSATSVYKVQFEETTQTDMKHLVWRAWALPKVKLFAWLAIQSIIWIPDKLAKHGCQNWPMSTL